MSQRFILPVKEKAFFLHPHKECYSNTRWSSVEKMSITPLKVSLYLQKHSQIKSQSVLMRDLMQMEFSSLSSRVYFEKKRKIHFTKTNQFSVKEFHISL